LAALPDFAEATSWRVRRTADSVCPVVGAATVTGHGLPGVLDVKEQLVANLGFAVVSRRCQLSLLRRS
jgi:hypothetical protein